MKVTVCFGAVRVVVPCGPGEILIRDLISESIRRYKKATGKVSKSSSSSCSLNKLLLRSNFPEKKVQRLENNFVVFAVLSFDFCLLLACQ
jgi:hypothetical protein